ncbi:MAG: asparagine synthase (glutamine-hydrolyzing) [Bacteroidales bacterium]|jgi:asparagine synthase (glutamine-hydrolysing)|nr:asparagine synthase (glutamine-hydrolyzing) [Bacteroidales bacterium]
MCGFVGIINKDGKIADSSLLNKMSSVIKHRGPDGEGIFIDGSVGFYHMRLSIIDLSTGDQPMTYRECTIVYNGEIYNYIELRNDLIKKGHNFITSSDTEVLLHMYIEYGDNFINDLNGMFAFIIYDKLKNRLIVAKDHFGIKPLYWYQDNNRIVFGSEIKAIIQHPDVMIEPDRNNLNEYLTFQYILGEGTMFKNISRLLPGHYMIFNLSAGSSEKVKYWEPDFKIDRYHTEEYFIVRLGEILDQTISQQLRSDVPLGSYLSGGLDSSFVTIFAASKYKEQFKSFTGAFQEGPEFNELEYAKVAAKAASSQLYEVFPTEEQFIDLLPKLIWHLDEPVAGPGVFPQYIVSKLASEHVKVVLGGQGGDEIFGGYTRYLVAYLEQAIKGAIYETNEEKEHIVSLQSILPNLPYLKSYAPMFKWFMEKEVFEPMDRRYFRLINRMGSLASYLTKDFMAEYNGGEIYENYSSIFNHPDTLSFFNKMTHFDMLTSLRGLLQVEDRVSMAVSLESRVPLLDRRIVDLISHMPAGMKFKGGEMKYLLKRTIKDIVPKKIMNRKEKMGFPVPLHLWARNKAKGFILDTLLSHESRRRNIIDSKYVEKLVTSERPFGRDLWGILCLELWFQQFIDLHH